LIGKDECVATRLLTTSTPSMIKMEVAPVSAIACVDAIVSALSCSHDALPKSIRAVPAIFIGGTWRTEFALSRGERLDVTTVMSSSLTTCPQNSVKVGFRKSI
jgi:hypothetical protein